MDKKPWLDLELGQKVLIEAKMVKTNDGDVVEYHHEDLEPPVEGIYVGWRQLRGAEKHIESDFDEMGGWSLGTYSYWEFTETYINVALVVTNARRNPLKVPFYALKPITTEEGDTNV